MKGAYSTYFDNLFLALRMARPDFKAQAQYALRAGHEANLGKTFDPLLADLETAINGFDEEYTGWGIGEDSDMGTRLYHLGRPRKFVYAQAVVYHLNHPEAPKAHVAHSLARLEETIRSRKLRCARGLDSHLAAR